jgi:uncharacterized protein YbbK (DUF523 family)
VLKPDDESMTAKPILAISSCLLGNRVRYDGELKHFPQLCDEMQKHCELLPVCPEVEIGLGVPRPPLQLSGDAKRPRMTGRDDASIDITDKMYAFCEQRKQSLKHVAGYIFKARSPSCGLHGIPLFDNGKMMMQNLRGVFAQAMVKQYPQLPFADEEQLASLEQQQRFIQQVLDYYKNHLKF